MSKKSNTDNEPSNAQIMRTLNSLSAKFDKLPTVEYLNKLENDLHTKIETTQRHCGTNYVLNSGPRCRNSPIE